MPKTSLTFQQKLALLRGSFIATLPDRFRQVRGQLAYLQNRPQDPEAASALHFSLHNLKGTCHTFGLDEIGDTAADAEQLLNTIVHDHSGDADAQCLKALRACLEKIEALSRSLPENSTPATPTLVIHKETTRTAAEAAPAHLVYVCDDDTLFSGMLATQLNCFGYRVEQCATIAELQQAVRQCPPTAVIMDIVFPDGDDAGTQMINDLHAEGYEFCTLFISARNDFDARLNALRAGGAAYFSKPFQVMDLLAALDALTQPPEPKPFKVLIVDDEVEVAHYYEALLDHAGMEIQVATEPDSVLNIVSEFKPDLVLMDIYMPKCSGLELAKLIRQIPEFISIPIVYLSSETDKGKQFSALSVGADGFLTKPVHADELVQSVALRAERMRTLRSLMVRDALTGLFNHSATTQFLCNAIALAHREAAPLCLAMIDLDRFKTINDTYGHPAGDQVILALARMLQQRLRHSDIAGRYGGEEFALILHNTDLAAAESLLNRLRQDFKQLLFETGAGKFSCTFSCGIAAYAPQHTAESLREAADKALYQAKHAGRNRVVCFQP